MRGIIYHVVDKDTNQVVKVGSTTNTLKRRFSYPDYQKKYTNHFLREAKVIESSPNDLYDKDDPYCPFLWHLVAAEHAEMLKQNTFRKGSFCKGSFCNQVSPLDQKYFGFDPFLYGSMGGKIAGRRNVESGHWATLMTVENCILGGRAAGAIAKRTGQINRIKTYESSLKGAINQSVEDKARGGVTQGNKNIASGHLERIRHIKNHQKRNKIVETCRFCLENK